MSFMDGTNLTASSELHGLVRAAVRRYAPLMRFWGAL
jgi:hypothetical protein